MCLSHPLNEAIHSRKCQLGLRRKHRVDPTIHHGSHFSLSSWIDNRIKKHQKSPNDSTKTSFEEAPTLMFSSFSVFPFSDHTDSDLASIVLQVFFSGHCRSFGLPSQVHVPTIEVLGIGSTKWKSKTRTIGVCISLQRGKLHAKSSKSKTKEFFGEIFYLDQLETKGVLEKDIMKVFYLEDVCQSIETVFSIENAFVFLTFFVSPKKWTGVILVNSHW